MTPEQYCEDLTVIAMRLVGAVHDEGPEAVAAALAAARDLPAPHGTDPNAALAVVLAAAIPTDRTRTQLWGWTLGIPTDSIAARIPTGRQANAFAVEMALAGHLSLKALSPAEQRTVINTLAAREWPNAAIAAHLDSSAHTVAAIRRAGTEAAA
jgi:hypothetical protein